MLNFEGCHSSLAFRSLSCQYLGITRITLYSSYAEYSDMPTILVKGLSQETLKQLKRLKVELNCESWAELLEKLSEPQRSVSFTEGEVSEMKEGVREFIAISNKVSRKWRGSPTVVEEFRKSRRHEQV